MTLERRQSQWKICAVYAVLAVLIGLAWQTTLVRTLYAGNWTALFYHGTEGGGLPNEPAFANTYLFPNDFGFDGQYYRLIAHDPFRKDDYLRLIERPRMRYRRILIPLIGYTLALGRQPNIDAGLLTALLLFHGLGVYWLGRFASFYGHNPAWGWAYFLVPGTLAGLERGAIDASLAALTIAFALYLSEQSRYRLFAVLAMAGLCRDTGMFLILACAASAVLKRNWPRLAISCASLLPALAWYAYIYSMTPPDMSSNLVRMPLTDLVTNMLHHDLSYVKSGKALLHFTYYFSIAGIVLGWVLSFRFFFEDWKRPEAMAAVAFALMGILVQPAGLWVQPYHYGRILCPMLVLLALEFFRVGDWRKAIPACMVSPALLQVSLASFLRVVKHARG
jgi:hypothetical protein